MPKQIGGLRSQSTLSKTQPFSKSFWINAWGLKAFVNEKEAYTSGKGVILRAPAPWITRVRDRKHTKKMIINVDMYAMVKNFRHRHR